MVKLVVAVLLLASTTVAGRTAGVDWLTTLEVAPGDTLAVWTLVDSCAVWPSSFDNERDYLDLFRHMYENKGDYVAAVIYVADGSQWRITEDTRVVFHYPDGACVADEVIFPSVDAQGVEAVLSSRDGVVVRTTAQMLRSSDAGYYAYLRFPPGSLPRPVRRWWLWGGNRWGVLPPDHAEIQVGG